MFLQHSFLKNQPLEVFFHKKNESIVYDYWIELALGLVFTEVLSE